MITSDHDRSLVGIVELLTVDETARLLRVAPITVRRYIVDGRLSAVRVGRSVRVDKDSIGSLLRPVAPRKAATRRERIPRGRPFTMNDSFWSLVGIGHSGGVGDVSENKQRYLADAYADTHEAPDGR
jgi:excisionase family DNA binding protein